VARLKKVRRELLDAAPIGADRATDREQPEQHLVVSPAPCSFAARPKRALARNAKK